jgi:D-glycero-D-manno-heptose 1,7-bisphosphate phosphatase
LTKAFLARTPAVILDRDGVLNRRPPPGRYVERMEDIEWLPGSLEALRAFREAGYVVVVASNQAGVARGHVSVETVEAIHDAMRAQAVAAGGSIDAFYYCPHAWHAGCECRKPQPGLLFQAQRDFSLDLTRTWFLGDDERDLRAAEAAGAPSRLVTEQEPLLAHAHHLLGAEHAATIGGPCLSQV